MAATLPRSGDPLTMSQEKSESPPAGVSSIIHLANVSAAYGSSIFPDNSSKCTESNGNGAGTSTLRFGSDRYDGAGSAQTMSPLQTGAAMQEKSRKKACPKQHQLPMFLSKTYHMIDRCDPSIATWSASGDNFVVKNVEKFASSVLPQYFKHSNFSSFARQLNFYGFRKLKAEPILTADFDARTACYVRFYHEKFQRDKPELLQHIKRATKSDQQSKDDVESLKMELASMKDCMADMTAEFDRKMADMTYEFNRKISAMAADYEKLGMLMQQVLASSNGHHQRLPQASPDMMRSLSQVAGMTLQNSPSFRPLSSVGHPPVAQPMVVETAAKPSVAATGAKRNADDDEEGGPPTSRRRGSC